MPIRIFADASEFVGLGLIVIMVGEQTMLLEDGKSKNENVTCAGHVKTELENLGWISMASFLANSSLFLSHFRSPGQRK